MKFTIFFICMLLSYNAFCCSCVLGKFKKKNLKRSYDHISIGTVESISRGEIFDSLNYQLAIRYLSQENLMDIDEDGDITEEEKNLVIRKMRDSYSYDIYVVEFSLEKIYRGLTPNKNITLKTARHSGLCGFPFEKGEKYLLFSSKGFVHNCSYTSEISYIKHETLSKLKKWFRKE